MFDLKVRLRYLVSFRSSKGWPSNIVGIWLIVVECLFRMDLTRLGRKHVSPSISVARSYSYSKVQRHLELNVSRGLLTILFHTIEQTYVVLNYGIPPAQNWPRYIGIFRLFPYRIEVKFTKAPSTSKNVPRTKTK